MTLGKTLLPFVHPDGAQMVLLCWGQIMPWIWKIWDDPRFADIDLMIQLVSLCKAQNPVIN
jgi:hypothetical protein